MKEEDTRGKVLLIDSDQKVVGFLKSCAEQSGYDVSTLSSLKKIGETVGLFKSIRLDLVVISSVVASKTPEALPILRQVLECPVIVYNSGSFVESGGVRGSSYLEPWSFLDKLEGRQEESSSHN
jgi:DNA-binding NtrC family response regulator